jgi:hypothetical protein
MFSKEANIESGIHLSFLSSLGELPFPLVMKDAGGITETHFWVLGPGAFGEVVPRVPTRGLLAAGSWR